jgi:hypothetical protein
MRSVILQSCARDSASSSTFLGWRLNSQVPLSSAFAAAFVLLCLLHALLFAASLRLPLSIDKTTEISTAEEEPKLLETAE